MYILNFEIPGGKGLIQKFVRPQPEKCQIAMQQPEAPVENQAENGKDVFPKHVPGKKNLWIRVLITRLIYLLTS